MRRALAGNKSITAASASNDAAAARITQAKSGLLPKVNYSEAWTRSDNPVFVFSSLLTQHQFGEPNFQVGPLNRPEFLNDFQSELTADQPLYDAGKARRAVHSADLAKDITSEDVRRTQMDVIASVVRSYHDVQLGTDQLSATRQTMRSVEADLERAESRRSAGMATEADVLSIRVHLAGVHEEQYRRSADLDVARAALNDALGLTLDTPHTLAAAMAPLILPDLTLADYEQEAAHGRPEAHQVRLAKEIAQTDAAEARGTLLPQVNLHAAFEADRQHFYDRGGANWLVAIGLRWNLFNGFADKARIEESQSSLRRSAAGQERADSAIRLQVRRAWADLRAAEQRIESARAAQAEAEESLRISQNRYEAGLNTVTDLLRVETALLETRTRYLAAVHDQRIAATMLEFAAGALTVDSEVLNQ
ncbi:MAG TPA: TolC family protein [Bryobacteraceae bacterium]|nr:TolC family protein [Bryobacteraceae bacterium]